MRALAVGLASFLFAVGVAPRAIASVCGVVEDDEIRPYGKVRWGDFQGRRPDRRTGAEITMSLKVFYDTDVREESGAWAARTRDVCVAALMYKRRSSVQVDERNLGGLEHEQAHFDITEYFARKLSAELRSFQAQARSEKKARRRLERAVRKHYKQTLAAWQEMEERYDRETNHGGRDIRQEQWRRHVRGLLELDHGQLIAEATPLAGE